MGIFDKIQQFKEKKRLTTLKSNRQNMEESYGISEPMPREKPSYAKRLLMKSNRVRKNVGNEVKKMAKNKFNEFVAQKKLEKQAYKGELSKIKLIQAREKARVKLGYTKTTTGKGKKKRSVYTKVKKQNAFSNSDSGGFL